MLIVAEFDCGDLARGAIASLPAGHKSEPSPRRSLARVACDANSGAQPDVPRGAIEIEVGKVAATEQVPVHATVVVNLLELEEE
ncbi:MAG: hypothetical protein U0572_00110 [Phycisphaerales bacterium]